MFEDSDRQMLQTFFQEAREQLAVMEEGLLRLEFEPASAEGINEVFRCAHTIKGSAGLFDLAAVVDFIHQVEHVLELLRQQNIAITAELVALLLQTRDHMQALLDAAAAHMPLAEPDRLQGEALRVSLSGLAAASKVAGVSCAALAMPAVDSEVSRPLWHISARLHANVLREGMDIYSLLHYISSLGRIHTLRIVDDQLPPLEQLDAESSYLGFELMLESEGDKATLSSAFDFVREGSQIWVLPPRTRLADYGALIRSYQGDASRIGDILLQIGALTAHELAACLSLQDARLDAACADSAVAAARIGEIPVEQDAVAPELVSAALDREQRSLREEQSLRIASSKLDRLIDLVGELVIASSTVAAKAGQGGDAPTCEAVDDMAQLVENIRDTAQGLRMVEIGQTFSRLQRVVRELGRQLGKPCELHISGAEAELDQSVIEILTHLVRNAIDHGIEAPEQRAAAGKPATATLVLNAWHDSGCIVIEVSDDGAGLDTARILAKAVERGMVEHDAVLDDARIHQLIFEPGFSTADTVSNLSGRGVGMDVVRRNITALRGSIEVETAAGRGTTFRIRLPLTLAIIDSLQVRVGHAGFVIPLDRVVECVAWNGRRQSGDCIELRGSLLPVVHLRTLYDIGGSPAPRQNVVVAEYGATRLGIVVDALCGEHQAVIKPLGPLFASLQSISGTTVLGSGQIALILDVAGLCRTVTQAAAGSSRELRHAA